MQANDDEENANQVLRSVVMAFANLKTRLGEYLDHTAVSKGNELIDMNKDLKLQPCDAVELQSRPSTPWRKPPISTWSAWP